MNKPRLLLADDHPLILDADCALLGKRYEIVGFAPDGRALVEAAFKLRPDLILLDISMPLLSGIEAARRIRPSLPQVKLLFFTMHSERPYLQAAYEAGATGYVLKSAGPDELQTAVQKVLNGEIYVSRDISEYWRPHEHEHAVKSLQLSPREREVLHLVAEGRSAKEMANILNISVKTVSFHRENIKQKLGVRSTAELTRDAIARGFM